MLLLHILLFDKAYNLTYWLNYSELKAQLQRRLTATEAQRARYHLGTDASLLAVRLAATSQEKTSLRAWLLAEHAPVGYSSSLTSPIGSADRAPALTAAAVNNVSSGLAALVGYVFDALAPAYRGLPSLSFFKAGASLPRPVL